MRRVLFFGALMTAGGAAHAAPVAVRCPQGTAHGFLRIETLEGKPLAVGDLVQTIRAGRVTSRLTFHFKDGSLDDETTVYTQRGTFRMVSDHHVQSGPFFPHPMEVTLDAGGHVVAKVTDKDGAVKVTDEHMDLPPDVANGMHLTLIGNLTEKSPETKVSMVLVDGKPMLATLAITPEGTAQFTVGGARRPATLYKVKIELGGMKGVIAPMIGKEPKDFHLWYEGGPAPVFLRAEGQLYAEGPVVRIEQISASFPADGQ